MARYHIRHEAGRCFKQYYGMQKNSRLGYAGLFKLLICAAKHNIGNAETKYLIGLFKIFLCERVLFIKALAHSRKLCTLTGKYVCVLHAVCLGCENRLIA